jgi:3-phenylpropionate/trans-cinnamate dioxygenase ferredoxin subunit
MRSHVVARDGELAPGESKIVDVAGRSIGLFNVAGTYYALRNRCPHQGAPLCMGSVQGTAHPTSPGEYAWGREGEILRCPWHGWEFDITTGRSLFNPHSTRVRKYEVTVASPEAESVDAYPVSVEGGLVLVHL